MSYNQLKKLQEHNKVIRIAKYSRCSSDEQKKSGYTIDDQLNYIESFAQEHELVTAGTYVDEGVSATLEISKRKDLSRLIRDAQEGKFDIVIFKCIDRFFRNVGEYYECQKLLSKAGVTWLSIEESDLDPNNDDAVFKINIYLTMAEYEARKTSKRIKFNNKMRIKNHQVVTASFPFPWKVVGEQKNKTLSINKELAPYVYQLLDYYETHQSKSGTVKWFNNNVSAEAGFTLEYGALTRLLSNTLLYGEYHKEPDYVEPYINKERFDRIQAILKKNVKNGSINHNVFLFSGILKCPECGNNLSGNIVKKKYHTYRCNKAKVNNLCSNTLSYSEKKIEIQLLDKLDTLINREIIKIENIKSTAPVKNNDKKIKEIKEEMNRLNIMFRKKRISEEEYDTDYLSLEKKLSKLESDTVPTLERDISHLKELLNTDYRGLYEKLDREHKRAFWRKIIKQFSVDENRKLIEDSIIFF